ncbi:hypothetical protein ANCDUO_18328, partial [Ancylostoma duodenale]
ADPLVRFKDLASATKEPPRVLITGSLGQLGRGLNTVYKWLLSWFDVFAIVDAPSFFSLRFVCEVSFVLFMQNCTLNAAAMTQSTSSPSPADGIVVWHAHCKGN